jgi:4-amino-4-deoxychorismate lyase
MAMRHPPRRELVVTLDGLAASSGLPVVGAADPLFARGAGVFETLLVRGGRPCLLDAHLTRLRGSAAIAGLAPPEPARWRMAVSTAVNEWADTDADADEAVLRLVYGLRRDGAPMGFVTVSPLPARVASARRDGVAVVTLDRGGPDTDSSPPWSLAGAKSVAYAVNVAALRQAAALGADDAIFTTPGGVVLEGPRSTVVVDAGGTLVTPPTSLPILPGTTVGALFDVAAERGISCRRGVLRKSDLLAAQGVWLLSSMTLVARVRTVDGVLLPFAPRSGELTALVDAALAG